MKKDIAWLKEAKRDYLQEKIVDTGFKIMNDINNEIDSLIDQLDDPEVSTEEWIVIPKFVAEHIKKWKNSNVALSYAMTTLQDELTLFRGDDEKVKFWLYDSIEGFENQEIYARAWLDGFTIANEEEEQKYNVNFRVNSSFGAIGIFLYKEGDEVLAGNNFRAYFPQKDECRLTEQEIRDFQNGDILFEHFAVKVEELEE